MAAGKDRDRAADRQDDAHTGDNRGPDIFGCRRELGVEVKQIRRGRQEPKEKMHEAEEKGRTGAKHLQRLHASMLCSIRQVVKPGVPWAETGRGGAVLAAGFGVPGLLFIAAWLYVHPS